MLFFPADEVLEAWLGHKTEGTWADADAEYAREIVINLNELFPVVAAPASC